MMSSVSGSRNRRYLFPLLAAASLGAAACSCDESSLGSQVEKTWAHRDGGTGTPLRQLPGQHADHRFGMFLRFGIPAYTGRWSDPNLPSIQLERVNLNPAQCADAGV